jgi:hypothetical protein
MLGRNPPVLLGRELEQVVEPVARLEDHQVGEAACLSSTEHGEDFVDGEFLAT